MLDSRFLGGSESTSAIVSDGLVYARNVSVDGQFASVIKQKGHVISGSTLGEYVSDSVRTLWNDAPQRSLGLLISETPTFHDPDTANWGRYEGRWYGDVGVIQPLLNSGKSTIMFPAGAILSHATTYITVPASVRRIIAFHGAINCNVGPRQGLVFQVQENAAEPLIIEQFGYGVGVEHSCGRTVVLKHGGFGYYAKPGAGDVYFEDVESDSMVFYTGQNVWMRQLNTEGSKLHITNNGAKLWILGIKTEGKGTVIRTTNNGYTELLGTLLYPCQSFTDQDGPAFIIDNAYVSLIYRVSSYVNKGNYLVQVEEKRGTETRRLTNPGEAMIMPLFSGYDQAHAAAHALVPRQAATTPHYQSHSRPSLVVRIGSNPTGGVLYDMAGRRVPDMLQGGRSVMCAPAIMLRASTMNAR